LASATSSASVLAGRAELTQSTVGSSLNWPIAAMSFGESNDGLCRMELTAYLPEIVR
jgi:hypothetical protein